MWNRVKTGDMLGEMTDEFSGKGITSFVSKGPKSYSFKYSDNEQKSAIKGFTLMSQSIPTGYIPPGQPPGISSKTLPGGSGFDF